MKGENRYNRAQKHLISSKDDIRAFALDILMEEGLDPSIVNFSEEGVTIHALKKFMFALYDVGYRDGLKMNAELRGKRREMEATGKILEHHRRVSADVAKKNLINKI